MAKKIIIYAIINVFGFVLYSSLLGPINLSRDISFIDDIAPFVSIFLLLNILPSLINVIIESRREARSHNERSKEWDEIAKNWDEITIIHLDLQKRGAKSPHRAAEAHNKSMMASAQADKIRNKKIETQDDEWGRVEEKWDAVAERWQSLAKTCEKK